MKANRLPVSARPSISTPDPHNARTGFFEESDFRAVVAELPKPLRPALQFAYWTGWRVHDEVMSLTWGKWIFEQAWCGWNRIRQRAIKDAFSFAALPELAELLQAQREHTSELER